MYLCNYNANFQGFCFLLKIGAHKYYETPIIEKYVNIHLHYYTKNNITIIKHTFNNNQLLFKCKFFH